MINDYLSSFFHTHIALAVRCFRRRIKPFANTPNYKMIIAIFFRQVK